MKISKKEKNLFKSSKSSTTLIQILDVSTFRKK